VLAALVVWCVAAPHADAGERTLFWSQLAVRAHLDAAGRLHVRERHVMVFDGAWNGGYRQFNVRSGQTLSLERLARVDPGTGTETVLAEGDLDVVDHYGWESKQLRWRSRRPSDPPFVHQPLTYDLDYVLSGILTASDEHTFVLAHDFAFPERPGIIERFELAFDLDPVWRAEAGEPSASVTRERVAPGESVIVRARLRYAGSGTPAAVRMPVPLGTRGLLALVLAAAMIVVFVRFYRREAALGRFAPLVSPQSIDEAWLREHVLQCLPEEVGAAWDDTVGPAEVAAVLARLVAEGKLETRVEERRILLFRRQVLHLRLTVSREAFQARGHEQALVAALFDRNAETDSDRVRKRYERTGFDPAATIRAALERRVRRDPDMQDFAAAPLAAPALVLAAGALALVVWGVWREPPTMLAAGLFAGAGVLPFGTAVCGAARWRKRIARPRRGAVLFTFPTLALLALFAVLCLGTRRLGEWLPDVTLPVLAGLAALTLAACMHVLHAAATRDGPRKLRRRQLLAAAREFFRRELRMPEPRLRDEWFPYLVAFGLGGDAERWSRGFGGESGLATERHSASRSPGSISGETASGEVRGGWTGGGGKFGGGGAGGSWVAAVGGLAAGVSAASSSSDGGGSSGGGSSSGGGGGGGW